MIEHDPRSGPDRPLILTDAGIETVLVGEGLDLPCFAAFPLIDTASGQEALRRYYRPFLELALDLDTPFALGTPTWRASLEWGRELGYDAAALAAANRRSVAFVDDLRRQARPGAGPAVLLEGVIGPRSDDVTPGGTMSSARAQQYHSAQVRELAGAGVDRLAAMTIADAAEAIGIVRAARSVAVPILIGFTVGTDGRLPSGLPLGAAIEQVDRETDGAADGFMINCAHPVHFAPALAAGGHWRDRVLALRANASPNEPGDDQAGDDQAADDQAGPPDDDTPADLAARYLVLRDLLPNLTTVGGCCGTDIRHVAAIGRACLGRPTAWPGHPTPSG